MHKRLTIVLSLALFFLLVTPVRAEDSMTATTASSPAVTRQALKDLRQNTMQSIKELRSQYRSQLATFKDAQRKARVDALTTKLGTINQRDTSRMSTALTKMSQLLTEISTKATLAKKNGADTTALLTAITDAQTAISTAQAAVTAQAAKQYIPTITSETTVRTDMGQTVKLLQTDLKTTYQQVIAAKQAVQNAIVELAKVMPYVTGAHEATASNAAQTTMPTEGGTSK